MGRQTSTAILANERWGVPRSGTLVKFRYTGFWRMSRNQNRGFELGTRGRRTSTPALADDLVGFKSKHRATIYIDWILEKGRLGQTHQDTSFVR